MTQDAFFAQLKGSIEAEIKPLRTKVQDLSKKVHAQDGRMDVIENKCDEALKLAKSGGGSGRLGGAPGSSTGAAMEESSCFVPSHILLKNFAEYKTKKELGIDRPEAEKLLATLVEVVPQATKEHMIVSKMKVKGGGKSDAIEVPVVPGFADEVRGDVADALESTGYTFNGRNIWVMVQREPALQKRYSAFSRIRNFLEAQLEHAGHDVNVSIECTWQPDFVITMALSADSLDIHEVGYIDEDGDAHFNDNWTHHAFGISRLEFKSRLRVFKSRRRQ